MLTDNSHGVALFFKRRQKEASWQLDEEAALSLDEIKKIARILIIDDLGFTYGDLFRRDGYAIDEWKDVDDLSRIEKGAYDLILLDVHGVGKALSVDQGLGVLKHLRAVSPTQIVVAFSDSDFSLKYQEFFKKADATLAKSADYIEFRHVVDALLSARFSMPSLMKRLAEQVSSVEEKRFVQEAAQQAIKEKSSASLASKLTARLADEKTVKAILGLTKIAEKVYEVWTQHH